MTCITIPIWHVHRVIYGHSSYYDYTQCFSVSKSECGDKRTYKYLVHKSLTLVAGQTLQVNTRVGMNLMKYSRTWSCCGEENKLL